MFKKFLSDRYKELIGALADKAVIAAEELGGTGRIKKEAAVRYIVKMLPLNPFMKAVAGILLDKALDEAVEFAHRRFAQKEL